MIPSPDARWDLVQAMNRGDLGRIIYLTRKWSWNWNDLARSAARSGDRDLVVYFLGRGADSIDIYGLLYEAREHEHYDLYDFIATIASEHNML